MTLEQNRPTSLYALSNGDSVLSLTRYASPLDEYSNASATSEGPFLSYYIVENRQIDVQEWTRDEFWDLACEAVRSLQRLGVSKGDRVLHGFSCNSPYDLVFRLAGVQLGHIPVTVNWQADSIERVIYKAKLTEAKALVHDHGFVDMFPSFSSVLPDVPMFLAESVAQDLQLDDEFYCSLDWDDERIIIFTSGTTGQPKGVSLSHRSYLTNRLTYDSYFGLSDSANLDLLLVNPLHHTNSTALSDWGMRRRGTRIHLVQRYSTVFWEILTEVAAGKRDMLCTSLVARHFDFLETLIAEGKLTVDEARLKEALRGTDIFIGSAPVGPTTIERLQRLAGRAPHVRFGSTETCLQVMAIPVEMPDEAVMKAFQAGWNHQYQGEPAVGYYIGRGHEPFTRLKVVKSLDPLSDDHMLSCDVGEPGYLVTQGGNIMSGYVGDPNATEAALGTGWYNGLKDIVFTLTNDDGDLDYYWMSRESELLIRGGANYAYAQIEQELRQMMATWLGLAEEDFQLAVVGLRLGSEHEDSCCVTVELSEGFSGKGEKIESQFVSAARGRCTKAARPDWVRVAPIPRNFKGAVLYPQLRREFADWLR